MGHRTFWVLADYLSRNGIAVLRYDDRGVAKSKGIFENATSYDFANDASAAIDFLIQQTELAEKLVGIIGHSEGGLIAPVVATQNENVDFVLLLAGPSKNGRFVSENQMKKILLANGVSEQTAIAGSSITHALNDIVLNNLTLPEEQLAEMLKTTYSSVWQSLPSSVTSQLASLGGGTLTEGRIKMLNGDWYQAFLQHDPVEYLSQLDIPIYALFGEKDVQVSAVDHVDTMRQAASRNVKSKVQVLEDHNHLFQYSETGSMAEYQHIEQTISPTTLTAITQWIKGLR